MPNINLTHLASYKAYFNSLADQHVDIDGYVYGAKKVIQNDNRSKLSKRFLWAQPYNNVRYSDSNSDNTQKVKQANIAYWKLRESEKFEDEDDDFSFCESVIEDLIGRIMLDKRGSMVGDTWEMVLANIVSINTFPVEETIGSTQYIGWAMKIDFMDNTNLAYNADKWNS